MNNQSRVSYRFGNYLLEAAEKRLWRDNALVALTPKAFETMVVLVSNRGRVVEKNVLLDKVWADTFVEEGTLAQNILTLRKALGTLENGDPFIETVPRTGYRFIADVKEIIIYPEAINEGFNEEKLKLTSLSAETGEIVKQFDTPPNGSAIAEWKGNENLSFLTVEKGNTKLWELPLNGGEARVVLEALQISIFRFVWSPDGKTLIYEKGATVTNAILINSKD